VLVKVVWCGIEAASGIRMDGTEVEVVADWGRLGERLCLFSC